MTVQQWTTVFMGVVCSVLLVAGSVAGQTSAEEQLGLAEQAFERGDFQKALELVEPLLGDAERQRVSSRLKMLGLVRLGKTAEGIDAYDAFVKANGKDEGLLRELAVQSILPFRSDMREQVRGAAYSALKEIPSDEVVPYFQDGLSDGSGMIRVLVAEGMGKLPSGRQAKSFRNALKDKAGLVRVTILKALGRWGDPGSISLIVPLLKDEHRVVQVAAAAALYRLGQKEHWKTVEQATNVPEGYERGGALRMLGEIGDPKGLPLLEQGLRDKQPSIRAAAAASLGKLGFKRRHSFPDQGTCRSRAGCPKRGCRDVGEAQSRTGDFSFDPGFAGSQYGRPGCGHRGLAAVEQPVQRRGRNRAGIDGATESGPAFFRGKSIGAWPCPRRGGALAASAQRSRAETSNFSGQIAGQGRWTRVDFPSQTAHERSERSRPRHGSRSHCASPFYSARGLTLGTPSPYFPHQAGNRERAGVRGIYQRKREQDDNLYLEESAMKHPGVRFPQG